MIQNNDIRFRARISGRVQGVGFRWFVVNEAERLGVHGWVRNTPDGDVEVEAAGPSEVIAEFRRLLERGPSAARVNQVKEMAPSDYELPKTFEIVR